MTTPLTKGNHHIGLTVSKLEESAAYIMSLSGSGMKRIWKPSTKNW
jgi:hypothetical protein